jgi:hypothetical protein
MAARKSRKSPKSRSRKTGPSAGCKVTTIKGQGRRRICRDSKGRITSNKKA